MNNKNFHDLFDENVNFNDDQMNKFEQFVKETNDELSNIDEESRDIKITDDSLKSIRDNKFVVIQILNKVILTLRAKGQYLILSKYSKKKKEEELELCKQKINDFEITPTEFVELLYSLKTKF